MIPPTSIDGTDITGATIDGTEVTEITVDGQTVFTGVFSSSFEGTFSDEFTSDPDWSFSSSKAFDGNQSAQMSNSGGSGGLIAYKDKSFGPGEKLTIHVQDASTGGFSFAEFIFGSNTSTTGTRSNVDAYFVQIRTFSNEVKLVERLSGSQTDKFTGSVTFSKNQWNKLELEWTASGNLSVTFDGTLIGSANIGSAHGTNWHLGGFGPGEHYFDLVTIESL